MRTRVGGIEDRLDNPVKPCRTQRARFSAAGRRARREPKICSGRFHSITKSIATIYERRKIWAANREAVFGLFYFRFFFKTQKHEKSRQIWVAQSGRKNTLDRIFGRICVQVSAAAPEFEVNLIGRLIKNILFCANLPRLRFGPVSDNRTGIYESGLPPSDPKNRKILCRFW